MPTEKTEASQEGRKLLEVAIIVAAMLSRTNVLNVKSDHRRVFSRKAAVLAPVIGTLPNKLTYAFVH